jgi:hypothetical protein
MPSEKNQSGARHEQDAVRATRACDDLLILGPVGGAVEVVYSRKEMDKNFLIP